MNKEAKALINRHVGADTWTQAKSRAAELVAEGREIDGRQSKLSWAWGDLSLEVVPAAAGTPVSRALLEIFIEDLGYPHTSRNLAQLRTTCLAWPRDKRTEAPVAVHAVLASHPRRFDLVRDDMTFLEARKLAAWRSPSMPERRRSVTAIECANAAKSWSRSLSRRLGVKPSTELVAATADAWLELTQVVERMGIFHELLARTEAEEGVPA